MTRIFQIAGLLLAAAAVSWCNQGKGATKTPPAARPKADAGRSAAAKEAPPKAVLPKGNAPNGSSAKGPKLGPPLVNPNNPLLRLYMATPEQRERALEKLDPTVAQRVRKQLERFDSLPKDQQQAEMRIVQRWSALPAERKEAIEAQYHALNALPKERQGPVRAAIRRLQPMTDEQRSEILSRPQFRARFSGDELKIISELCSIVPPE